jgi:hypothetical protein
MNISPRFTAWLAESLISRVGIRDPDFIIGADNPSGAYLLRWYLTPWTSFRDRVRKRVKGAPAPTRWDRFVLRLVGILPNLYLHKFLRDDDDRALHDHPSWGASLILRGGYVEHTIAAGGVHHRTPFKVGNLRYMGTRHTHRIELHRMRVRFHNVEDNAFFKAGSYTVPVACWTLFLFGPTVREWFFHCEKGLVHWLDFTAPGRPGESGRGCD